MPNADLPPRCWPLTCSAAVSLRFGSAHVTVRGYACDSCSLSDSGWSRAAAAGRTRQGEAEKRQSQGKAACILLPEPCISASTAFMCKDNEVPCASAGRQGMHVCLSGYRCCRYCSLPPVDWSAMPACSMTLCLACTPSFPLWLCPLFVVRCLRPAITALVAPLP